VRVVPIPAVGFKVVVSTRRNHEGVGQLIKPGIPLYDTFRQLYERPPRDFREINALELSGIAGIENVVSGAARIVGQSICVAIRPIV
jgi:hypothetical protein